MKKGFTLIELMATIILLGIVILIAIPAIGNIVNESKLNTFKNKAQLIVKKSEDYYAESKMTEDYTESIFDLSQAETFKKLNIKGADPEEGILIINNDGKSSLQMTNGKYCATKSINQHEVEITDDILKCRQPNYIKSIEDLVRISVETNAGDNKKGVNYFLIKSLDFNNDKSYNDPSSIEFGDINKDGITETIKKEVTTSKGFPPINEFYGHFEGNINGLGNTLSNLFINRESSGQALIYSAFKSSLENINITGNVTSNKQAALLVNSMYSGEIINSSANGYVKGTERVGLLGSDIYSSKVEKCSTSGIVDATTSFYSGGLFGIIGTTKVNNVKSDAEVRGYRFTGGIGGYVYNNSEIRNASTSVTIPTGYDMAGGIAGAILNDSMIIDSNSSAKITSYNKGAGIVGQLGYNNSNMTNSYIANCYFTGEVKTTFGTSGTLVALLDGKAYNSYSKGTLIIGNVSQNTGGLFGIIGATDTDHSKVMVENVYFDGKIIINVSGGELGTIAGQNGASSENGKTKYVTLKNAYSTIDLNNGYAGLVGVGVMNAENLFNGGQMAGSPKVGGIVGYLTGTGAQYNNSYYVTQSNTMYTKIGTEIELTNLNSSFFQDTVKLGEGFKYTDGYYPLLYKRNTDGTYSNELVPGQTLTKLKQ